MDGKVGGIDDGRWMKNINILRIDVPVFRPNSLSVEV